MHACMHEHYIQYIFYTIDTAELYGAIYIVPPTYIMMLKCLLVIVDKHTEICNHANSNRSNCNWPRGNRCCNKTCCLMTVTVHELTSHVFVVVEVKI